MEIEAIQEEADVPQEPVTIKITVTNESVAQELAIGLIGRATELHENPYDDFDWIAGELKTLSTDILNKHWVSGSENEDIYADPNWKPTNPESEE